MIIGVDSGALSITDDRLKVGVYRVTLELLKGLSFLDEKNEYRLYSFLPIAKSILDILGKNMKNVVLSPAVGYFSLRLPLELYLHPVDVFVGASQAVPVMVKGRAIGVVHDLGFIHNPSLYGADAGSLKSQTKTLVTRSSHIVAVSETVKKDIVAEFGTPEEKITVYLEGVSEIFNSHVLPMKRNNPYFLFVGSQRKGKNIDTLVAIFHRFLAHSKKPYDLVLVGGDYWPHETIEKTIRKFHLERRICRTGVVSDEILARYYAGATAFVTASASEGFCLPAVEAMASGCPVIAYDAGAIGEVVGEAGMVAPPSDTDAFVRFMTMMADDPEKRRAFILAGKKKAKQYNWTTFAQNILHIIHADSS